MSEQDTDQITHAVRPNKTALKRERMARTELIERAIGLSDKELKRLGLDDYEIEQLSAVRSIRASGARNRQLKYCVKQLVDSDLSVIEAYLDNRHAQQLEVNQVFHELEQWRDRLLESGDALIGEATQVWPALDRQQLRQLIRDGQREQQSGKPVGAKRKLFRYLRELTEQASNA